MKYQRNKSLFRSLLISGLLTCLPNAYSGDLTQMLNGLFCPDTMSPSGGQNSREDRIFQLYRDLLKHFRDHINSEDEYQKTIQNLLTKKAYFTVLSSRSDLTETQFLLRTIGEMIENQKLLTGEPIQSELLLNQIQAFLSKELELLMIRSKGASEQRQRTHQVRSAIRELKGHQDAITSLVVSPDEKQFITTSADHSVILWNAQTSEPIYRFKAHTMMVTSATADPSFSSALTASDDFTIMQWNLKTGKLQKILTGHQANIEDVFASEDFEKAISYGGQTIILWDVAQGLPDRFLKNHKEKVTRLLVSPEFDRAISLSLDGEILVWRFKKKTTSHQSIQDPQGKIMDVLASSDLKRAISVSDSGSLIVWDTENREIINQISEPSRQFKRIYASSDRKWGVTEQKDGSKTLWDFENLKVIEELCGPTKGFSHVLIDTEQRRIVYTAGMGQIAIRRLDGATHLLPVVHKNFITGLWMSRSAGQLISTDSGGKILIWDLEMARAQ